MCLMSASHAHGWEYFLEGASWFDADFDQQGFTYVALQPLDGSPWLVHRLTPEGVLDWTASTDIGSGNGPHGGIALCGTAALCVNPSTRLSRIDVDTGLQQWVTTIEGNAADLAASGTDGVVAYSHFSTGLLGEDIQYARYDAPGVLQASAQVIDASFLSVNDQGALAYRSGDGHALYLLGPAEEPRLLTTAQNVPPTWSSVEWRRAVLDDMERLTYLSEENGIANLVRVGASEVAWTTPLFDVAEAERLRATRLIAGPDGTTFIVAAFAPWNGIEEQPPNRAKIFAVADDGSLLWQRGLIAQHLGEPEIVLGNDAHLMLVSPMQENNLVMARGFDATNGLLDGMHLISCDDVPCRRVLAGIDEQHRATFVAGAENAQVRVIGGLDLFGQSSIPIDQAALTGQWFAPYTDGQGFSLHYFEDSRTLFVPWFTFGRDGGNDPEQLRWYTMQAAVELGAREAILPILQRTGGRFDHPGSDQSIVGEARLRFVTCREGILEYRFDEGHNGNAAGSIALQRLLPLPEDCTEADGETSPAEATYDAALTGHWYDPATSGQGFEIQRIAPSQNAPGTLFATWFAYDPDEPTNVPEDQHWFTLQIEEPGDNGTVSAAIMQTLGGRFDSEPTSDYHQAGMVELISLACDRLDLRYEFDDSEAAGKFRGLSGKLDLHRLGKCSLE